MITGMERYFSEELVKEFEDKLESLRPGYDEYLRVEKATILLKRELCPTAADLALSEQNAKNARGTRSHKNKISHKDAIRQALDALPSIDEGYSSRALVDWLVARGHWIDQSIVINELHNLTALKEVERVEGGFPMSWRKLV